MPQDPINAARKDLDRIIESEKRNRNLESDKRNLSLLSSIGPYIVGSLSSFFENLLSAIKSSNDDLKYWMENVKIEVPKVVISEIKVPEIKVPPANVTVEFPPFPEFPKIPKPEVTVNVPPFKIPKLEWPEDELPIRGWVQLMGVDLRNPLPVQLRDATGKPVNLLENLTSIIGGGAGVAHNVRIGGFSQSAYSDYINADNRFRVSVETGGSGLTDNELRASAIPVIQVTGSNNSSQAKLIARQTNPTAVTDAAEVFASGDDLGRALVRPVQVRDLLATAYVSLATGTETTLLAASAGSFHDLIYVMASNNSDVAVTVDIRPATAGNIVMSIQVPANGTAGVSIPVPYPQSASDTGNNWTADIPDITGTTVYLSALFSREV